jgi:hypothetical protein
LTLRRQIVSAAVRAVVIAVLATAPVACGDEGSQPGSSAAPTLGATGSPTVSTTGTDAVSSTTLDAQPAGSPLDAIDPCALLGEGDFGPFVDAGTVGVEDDLGPHALRQCTWGGSPQDDFYTGLILQVHAQPDIAAITFDAEPAFVVEPIEGRSLPGAAVISAPNPDVEIEESVVFIAFDAGDVLVAILPWATVLRATPEFDALVDVTLTAASRAAG